MVTASDPQGQEIAAIIREIRDRVRTRYPHGEANGIGVALPDLMPLLHARDAAMAKVAAIGSVNPRPPGLVNNLIQSVKRNLARALGWFVRDQVEFNRAVLTALDATLEALNEANRTFQAAGGRIAQVEQAGWSLKDEANELKDIRAHWITWRDEWEKKLFQNEVHFLKGLSEMQAAMDARLTTADVNYRETVRLQHAEFTREIERAVENVHARFWKDAEKLQLEYERLIHDELRVMRQKAFASAAPAATAAPALSASAEPALDIDYARFAERFRGSAESVRERQRVYLPYFESCRNVLDIGCGRGEFLEMLRGAGVNARGVDLDEESVAVCRSKGLRADAADAFELLRAEPDASFDGIFASQVIEHMSPARVPELVKLCSAKLKRGGVLALETPNPECLAIFATHFYMDPTHTRPVPPNLMVFYYEEYGFGGIEVHRLAQARESMPEVDELPVKFRDAFFGALDYGVTGRKL